MAQRESFPALSCKRPVSPSYEFKGTSSVPVSLLLNFAVEYGIKMVQEDEVELKLNGINQLLAYFSDFFSCVR
jgi:hypothetical protein